MGSATKLKRLRVPPAIAEEVVEDLQLAGYFPETALSLDIVAATYDEECNSVTGKSQGGPTNVVLSPNF